MYGISNWDFPKLRNFDEAYEYWSRQKPYTKGKNKGLRPLRQSHTGRNTPHYRIEHIEPDVVAVQLYDTNVVEFHRSGDIFITSDGWNTNMTASLVQTVLRSYGIWLTGVNGHWCLQYPVHSDTGAITMEYQTRTEKHSYDFHLRPTSDTRFELVDPHQWTREYVRRDKMSSIRKKYAKPIKYIMGMARLQDPVEVEKISLPYFSFGRCREVLESSDASDWWDLAIYVYKNSTVTQWEYGVGYVYSLPIKRVKEKLTAVLKSTFYDEVVERRVRPSHLVPKMTDQITYTW